MKTNTSCFECRIEKNQFIITVLKAHFIFMLSLYQLNFDQNERLKNEGLELYFIKIDFLEGLMI